jgi:hypothetical protein
MCAWTYIVEKFITLKQKNQELGDGIRFWRIPKIASSVRPNKNMSLMTAYSQTTSDQHQPSSCTCLYQEIDKNKVVRLS